MKPKDLILGNEAKRNKSIGKNIKTYRECSNLLQDIFAERCGISAEMLKSIEKGEYRFQDISLVLRIAEELKIGLSDLFETEDSKYYAMFHDYDTVEYIFTKKKKAKMSNAEFMERVGIKDSAYHNWREKRHIPSPFVLQNFLTVLNITSRELAKIKPIEKPAEKEVKQEKKSESTDLDAVIKACEMYKQIPSYIEKLNEVIRFATELRDALGGVQK